MEATTSQKRKKEKMENVGFKESLSRDDHTEVIFCHSIKTIRTFLGLNKVFLLQQGVAVILSE